MELKWANDDQPLIFMFVDFFDLAKIWPEHSIKMMANEISQN